VEEQYVSTKSLLVGSFASVVILVVAVAGVAGQLLSRRIWGTTAEAGAPVGFLSQSMSLPREEASLREPCSARGEIPADCYRDFESGSESEESLAIEQVHEEVSEYLARHGYDGLQVRELMEFRLNFYAIVSEEDTGIGAMELLIDRETGAVGPEHGPNMMWNTKYGMNGGDSINEGAGQEAMTVSPREALRLAQRWLDKYRPGTTVGPHVDPFYGYYTIHTLRDGEISGMLSVREGTGEVWYHNWHGEFVQLIEGPEHEPHS
jgi:hypothetical protein